jgi:hypothetical protein
MKGMMIGAARYDIPDAIVPTTAMYGESLN